MQLAPGTRLGPYRIIEPIGSGGMGEVYRARDPRLERDVAIKRLSADLSHDSMARTRFATEMRAVAALAHPNILTIFDVGEDAGVWYTVMELVTGRTLHDVLRDGRLPLAGALEIAGQIAAALAAAHARGVFHLDLKPGNVMVLDDGRVKLLDFGLARIEPEATSEDLDVTRMSETAPAGIAGSPGYLSPEQARGLTPDHRSDVFSFGAVLYELVSGRRAFSPTTFADAIAAALVDEPPAFDTLVPPAVDAIVRRCLAKAPSTRYESAGEVVSAIAAARRALDNSRSSPAPSHRQQRPSVAVLPFADMSAARDQEYFCDGMAEELISALATIDGLSVASRTSAFQFKGANPDLKDVATALNVESVLEGGVRRAGDKLRVTVRLTRASDGSRVWSERFDRDAGDIFAVQDEIARTVVAALRGSFAGPTALSMMPGHSTATLVHPATDSLEAYSCYLQARFHWRRRTVADARRSLELFEQAIGLDPSYAQAHLGVADTWLTLALYGGAAPREAMSRARVSAERALMFNPALAEAEATLGSIQGLYDWLWTEADARFARAEALAPGSGTVYHWRAMHSHLPLGRFAEAEQALRHALSLDPLSMASQASLGLVLHFAGRADDAVGVLQAAIATDPAFAVSHVFLGEVLVDQGRGRAAVDAFETARRLSPTDPKPLAGLVQAHALLDEMTRAVELAGELDAVSRERYVSPVLVAQARLAFGDREAALDAIERACDERAPDLTWAAVRPGLASLRGEGRFRDIIARMRLHTVRYDAGDGRSLG